MRKIETVTANGERFLILKFDGINGGWNTFFFYKGLGIALPGSSKSKKEEVSRATDVIENAKKNKRNGISMIDDCISNVKKHIDNKEYEQNSLYRIYTINEFDLAA